MHKESVGFSSNVFWRTRYAPYIYIFVLIAVAVLLSSDKRVCSILALVFVIGILFNNCLPLKNVSARVIDSKAIDANFKEMTNVGPIEVFVWDSYEGVYYNLEDYGISYTVNTSLRDNEGLNEMVYKDTTWR